MIIVNESPYFARIVKRHVKLPSDFLVVSTGGFLYDYLPDTSGKSLIPVPKKSDVVSFLSNLEGEKVVVATDLDPAGELIAVEVCSLVNPFRNEVFRFTEPFDRILLMRDKSPEEIRSVVESRLTNRFDAGKAAEYVRFVKTREREPDESFLRELLSFREVSVRIEEKELLRLSEKFSEYL